MRWQDPKPAVKEDKELEEALERFIDELASREELLTEDFEGLTTTPGGVNLPKVDLEDAGDVYRLVAELPGVSSRSLRVVAVSDSLTLEGRWDYHEERDGQGKPIIAETGRGKFKRVVNLPGPTKGELANAVLENGVLTIELPKAESHSDNATDLKFRA